MPTMPNRLRDQAAEQAEGAAAAAAEAHPALARSCPRNCCFRVSPPSRIACSPSPLQCLGGVTVAIARAAATGGAAYKGEPHESYAAKSHSSPARPRASASPSPAPCRGRRQGHAQRLRRRRRDRETLQGASWAPVHDGADLGDPAAIEAMIARCTDELGAPDILVNNAGIQHVAPVDQFPPDKWDAIMAINLSAVFHTTRLALPGMRRRAGAGSSTRRAPTASSPAPTSRPMSPPSMASPASPRRWRWKRRATASPSIAFRRAMSGRPWSKTRSPTR